MLIPAVMLDEITALYEWKRDFINGSAELLDITPPTVTGDLLAPDTLPAVTEAQATEASFAFARQTSYSAILKIDSTDIKAANLATDVFHRTLKTIFEITGTVAAAALVEWNLRQADLETDFAVIDGNVGAEMWRLWDKKLRGTDSSAWETSAAISVQVGILTNVVQTYIQKYIGQMQVVAILADVDPSRI